MSDDVYPLLGRVVEGKTKVVYHTASTNVLMGRFIQKNDITAGNGTKHDVIPNKGAMSTTTTSNVFRFLKSCGVPMAFTEQIDETSFVSELCEMLPLEVVVRREAHGSYIKRNPHLKRGHLFPRLIFELYLKTAGWKWYEHILPCDDPYMVVDHENEQVKLYEPDKPLYAQPEPFLTLSFAEAFGKRGLPDLKAIENTARFSFLVLEKAWQLLGLRLVDFKVEFGINSNGKLRLADVISNDEWRLVKPGGAYVDKQVYRDGGNLATVVANYQMVATLTDRFNLPRQQLILWRGSEKDDFTPFIDNLKEFIGDSCAITNTALVTGSMHKEPEPGLHELDRLVHEIPDSVVIAFIGMSNGAGPTLSAHTTVPVISVPASIKDFPDDIWSSLRTPSMVPNMTVLSPANAVLAALNTLSTNNPCIYAALRLKLEERRINTVRI